MKRKIERLSRQSAQMLTQLALSDLQLRALNMGQDRFRRRLWILPHAGGVYLEAMESGEANAGPLVTWDGKPVPPIGPRRNGDEEEEPAQEEEGSQVKSEPISEEHSSVQKQQEPKSEQDDKPAGQKLEPMDEDEPVVKKEAGEEEDQNVAANVKTEEESEAAATVPTNGEVVEPKKEEETVVVNPPEVLPALWFSLFPRTPCDPKSLVNVGKDRSDAEDGNDGRAVKKEEAAKEEAEKIIMQPIPEGDLIDVIYLF